MSTNGMIYPQEKPMLAGNPKDSAIAANNQAITKQSDLIKATSGGNRPKKIKRNKKYKYGGATTGGVVVPQYQMQYDSPGAAGQTPNDIIKQNASISTQGSENAKYDNLAKKGGSRKKRGGNSNWSWGCYSGGKKKSKKYTNKRKTYKKRRTNRRK
jgi:hypothetical protein